MAVAVVETDFLSAESDKVGVGPVGVCVALTVADHALLIVCDDVLLAVRDASYLEVLLDAAALSDQLGPADDENYHDCTCCRRHQPQVLAIEYNTFSSLSTTHQRRWPAAVQRHVSSLWIQLH